MGYPAFLVTETKSNRRSFDFLRFVRSATVAWHRRMNGSRPPAGNRCLGSPTATASPKLPLNQRCEDDRAGGGQDDRSLGGQPCRPLAGDGECGELALLFGFSDDGVEVGEDFGDGHGVDFAAGVVAFFDELLEVAAGDLDGELVGDHQAGALLLGVPGIEGQGDPHRAAVDGEADIDSVSVAGGDGDNVGFPGAVEVFAGPAVGNVEIVVHKNRV